MSASETIKNLVERFDRNYDQYHSGKYNETQLRREFLDPFFELLGWDIFNKQGYVETYKDVIHEDSLEIEGATKAPDYAFRVGGQRKFFVEAKKPSVNIEQNIHPAFQLRRYAWSAKLPLGILSDFEEFAVYDCRMKPDKGDKASVGRVMLLSYKDYVEKWDELVSIFSRDAVLKGSFDSYAEGMKTKKGTTEVDDAFLGEIERWRDLLAKNIALRNQTLSVRELNYAVQMTIDRIVFLRICEDRGVERDEQLKEIASGDEIYKGLVQLFQKADARYNSGLFHFKDEKEQSSAADNLTLGLNLDDKPLRDILLNLYYPDSPYVFREIPSDILGQVYERFLGKVIRLTAGHQAKVEEKPEVRKAGGVYYTPTYIVNYIVQNTVGKLLEGKTPKDAEKLRILDPACGSGTFPLGAYQYLLDWHLDWYINHDPEKIASGKNPAIFQSKDGWLLTTSKKKEILLNNIYGVDIDAQAVEVTKLSLLLKVLEGESQETIGSQLSLLQERVLPDLSKNIQCGNSLIGPDYYEGHQLTIGFGDDEERYRVNAFDWKGAFPQVFIHGGFDAVIGNPPYIRSQTLESTNRDYFTKVYKSATKTYDIYVLFIEKAVSMLSKTGRCGFILPNKFFTTDYGEGLRKLLGSKSLVDRIVDFEDGQIFAGAGTYTNLLFLRENSTNEPEYIALGFVFKERGSKGLEDVLLKTIIEFEKIKITDDGSRWTLASGKRGNILLRTQEKFPPFADFSSHIFQGLKTSADKVFLIKVISENGNLVSIENGLGEKAVIEKSILKPVVKGEDVRRYYTDKSQNLFIIYPYTVDANGKARTISSTIIEKNYPKVWAYLNQYKKLLGARDNGIWLSRDDWYVFARSQNIGTFAGEKFLLPYMTTRLRANLDKAENLFFVNITTGGYGFRLQVNEKPEYVLGLLNSMFLNHAIQQMTNKFRGGYFAVNKQGIERLPYRPINFSDSAEVAKYKKMVSLVERMLSLQKQPTARTPQEQEMVKREIESTDRAIDKLVYELYGLTEEEIKIVERKDRL